MHEIEKILIKLIDDRIELAIARLNVEPKHEFGDIDFALEVLNQHGKFITKATLYNKTHLGQVPCKKVGKRKLIFYRKELETWLKQGMPDISKIEATERLRQK